jgi:putative transposase
VTTNTIRKPIRISLLRQYPPLFNRLQYPTDVVCLVILWRFRYKLSLRDLAEMFLQRGLTFTHEAVRDWEHKLAPLLSEALRKRRRVPWG